MSIVDRRTLGRIANTLGVVVLLALVVPFVVYGAPQVVGADASYIVLSGSMEPAMSPGDAVIVREAPPGSVEAGDVITYRTEGPTPTTHRVIEVIEREGGLAYATKGDANEDPDSGLVSHDQVIGTVLLTIPLLGYVVGFLNTPVGFAALIVLPIAIFVVAELRSLVGSIDDADPGTRAASGEAERTAPNDATTAAELPDGATADAGESEGSADDGTEATGGSSVTLTRSSLQLIGLLFAVYLPYSAYVAYELREPWALTVAIGTGIGLLFVGGLFFGSRPSGEAADRQAADADGQQSDQPVKDDGSAPESSAVADGGATQVEEGGSGDRPDETEADAVDRSADGFTDRAVVERNDDA